MAITAALAAARTSGLVPLSVFLDATSTASDETTREFHEVYFEWDFGDSGAGNWPAITNMPTRSKNAATGPLAHHVFETAGVYTVTLRVFDGVSYDEETVEITATDWEEGVTGTTLVVAHDADYTGAPSHAAESSSTDFDAVINANIATRKRILFKRGGTYTASAASEIDVAAANGGIIGAWGSGAKPLIEVGNFSACLLFRSDVVGDWRVMDLEIDGNSNAASEGSAVWEQHDRVLLLRIDFHNLHVNVRMSPFHAASFGNTSIWTDWAIVDCTLVDTIGGSGGNGVYIGAQNFAFQGNVVEDTTGAEHCTRWPGLYKAVISHNRLADPAATKLVVKMQAAMAGEGWDFYPSDATEFIIFSNNKCRTLTAWNVVFGPQDGSSYAQEDIQHVIAERNYLEGQQGGAFANLVVQFFCMGNNHTIRNNVVVLTGTAGGANAVDVDPFPGGSNSTQSTVHVYNNTVYAAASSITAFLFGDGTGHLAYSNIVYSPSGGSVLSGSGYTASNNSSSITTDPDFASATPADFVDFKITAGSYAIGAGIDTEPVFDDAFGSARDWQTPNTDIGFHAFTEGAFPWEEGGEFNSAWATSANPQGVLA